MLVFVYGKLAKGGSWHHLVQKSKCESNQVVTERTFTRNEVGASPDSSGECLHGQVYHVGNAQTFLLDRVEKPLTRQLEWVYLKDQDDKKLLVYVYGYF